MNKELYNEQLKNPNKQLFPEFYRNRPTDSDLRYKEEGDHTMDMEGLKRIKEITKVNL